MIKVAIADDQVLLRDMLRIMLLQDPEIEVVGSAGDGAEIVKICATQQPDIALIDIKMPLSDGIAALKEIKQEFPQIKVVMLTTFEDESSISLAYQHGADGYILKDVKPQVLVMAVKCINEGLCVIHHSVQQFLVEQYKANSAAKILVPSRDKEGWEFDRTDREIIRFLAEGRNNKDIADALNFSEGTIKNRISRMLNLTGLKDRTQMAVYALKNKII